MLGYTDQAYREREMRYATHRDYHLIHTHGIYLRVAETKVASKPKRSKTKRLRRAIFCVVLPVCVQGGRGERVGVYVSVKVQREGRE